MGIDRPAPRLWLWLGIVTVLTLHCQSVPIYDLSAYPRDSRTLFLQNFTNNSFQPDANVELTDAVRLAIGSRGNFVLLDDRQKAKLRLFGRISLYRKEGRMFDNLRQPIRTELVIACRVRVQGDAGELFTGETAASVEYSSVQGYVESEETARRRLNRLLAQRIAAMVERWFIARFPAPPAASEPAPDGKPSEPDSKKAETTEAGSPSKSERPKKTGTDSGKGSGSGSRAKAPADG